MHYLRHCFASMLIREGADVVFVARQLGHANPRDHPPCLRAPLRFRGAGQADARGARGALRCGNAVVTSNWDSRAGQVVPKRPAASGGRCRVPSVLAHGLNWHFEELD